jgi:thymidylate kinase
LEREALDFHRDVRNAYLKLARSEKKRILVVDANRPVPAVHASVLAGLKGSLA